MKLHHIYLGFAIALGSLLGAFGTASVANAPPETLQYSAREAIDSDIQQVAQAQAQRYALVIGIADYETSPLRNPVNDAKDMAAALEDLGFEVNLLLDATLPQIEAAVEQLNQQLRRGGTGMVFYAGHGVQVNGENYLMPIGATINREQDVRYEAYPLGRLLGSLEDADNDLNIVILDACRNNPFARQWRSSQGGLAPVQSARGTLVAYATYPGGLADDGSGRNGVYTEALLKHIDSPLSVELMLKRVRADVITATDERQVPWESSSLVGDFSFNLDANTTTAALPTAVTPPTPAPASAPPTNPVAAVDERQVPDEATAPSPTSSTTASPSSDPAPAPTSEAIQALVALGSNPRPPAPAGVASPRPPRPPGAIAPPPPRPPRISEPSQPSRTISGTFQAPPQLLAARTTNSNATSSSATYYFTIELPAEMGSPLQQVEIQLRDRVSNFRFVPEKTQAFVGTSARKGQPLAISGVTQDEATQTIRIRFEPPVTPGQTITVGLKPARNPRQSNAYQFGVTVFPVGEGARGLYLGAGRLQFKRPGTN